MFNMIDPNTINFSAGIVKCIGGVLMIGSSTGIGMFKANLLDERIEQVEELQRILIMMKNEIAYKRTALPEIIDNITKHTNNKELKKIFKDIQNNLIEQNSLKEAANIAIEKANIDKKIKYELYDLFNEIGNSSDIEGEINLLEYTENNLNLLLKEFVEYRNKYGKLYRGLPVLGSIGLALILG